MFASNSKNGRMTHPSLMDRLKETRDRDIVIFQTENGQRQSHESQNLIDRVFTINHL
mgnify:CR=1 FL=1